jgi:hypothetical protein
MNKMRASRGLVLRRCFSVPPVAVARPPLSLSKGQKLHGFEVVRTERGETEAALELLVGGPC